jgi:hypothetical protein
MKKGRREEGKKGRREEGKMLELGCRNENNPIHFAAYGWDVTGVDIDSFSVADGEYNLRVFCHTGSLIHHDLNNGLPSLDGQFKFFWHLAC